MVRVLTEKAQVLLDAGIESIRYRQALSPLGGIVESDPRVDRGNYLYADRCWLRNFHIEPLLYLGHDDVVLKNIDYWLSAFNQLATPFFRHTYNSNTAEQMSLTEQTDNNAYFIIHIWHAWKRLEKGKWFRRAWPVVRACANYICSQLNTCENLILGVEERVIEGLAMPKCFSFYINRVCAVGLEYAVDMAGDVEGHTEQSRWAETARLIRESIERRLWDSERGSYAYLRFPSEVDHHLAGKLVHDLSWGCLWAFIHDSQYSEKDMMTTESRLDRLWRRDPLLPGIIAQKEPHAIHTLLETGDDKAEFHYSGVGVNQAANAVAAWLMAARHDKPAVAKELWAGVESVPGDMNLLPEHINTLHPGRMKDYTIWPDEKSCVDCGNLMHLTMMMTMAVRLKQLPSSDELKSRD